MNIGPFYVYIGSGDAPIRIDELFEKLEQMETRIMSKIEDKLTAIEGTLTTIGTNVLAVGTSVSGVKADVEANAAEIAALKEQIANEGMTPEVEARFDALVIKTNEASVALAEAATALAAIDAMNPMTPPAETPAA